MNKFKLLLASTTILFAFFLSYRLGLFNFSRLSDLTSETQSVDKQDKKQNINLIIYFGNEDIRTYEYSFSEEETVYDALKEISERENISLETKEYDFGILVSSIGGKENSSQMAWIYFVNGEAGQIAADQMQIENKDLVEWKYITPNGE